MNSSKLTFQSIPLDIKKIIWGFVIGNLSFPTLNLFLVCKEWNINFQILFNELCKRISTDTFTGLWFILKCYLEPKLLYLCYPVDGGLSYLATGAEYKGDGSRNLTLNINVWTYRFFKSIDCETRYIVKNNCNELTYILANILAVDLSKLEIMIFFNHNLTKIERDLYDLFVKYFGPVLDNFGWSPCVNKNIRYIIERLNKNNIIEFLKIIKK